MNLPPPEDSGVPPDDPDYCILRIRRNHLIEARALTDFTLRQVHLAARTAQTA